MKSIISAVFGIFLLPNLICAQNIPTANWTGPGGVQVNTWNGNLYLERTDMAIPNQGVFIDFTFFYNSFRDTLDIGFGKGWTSTYSFRYYADSTGIVIERPDGRADFFNFIGGVYKSPKGIFDRLEAYQAGKFRLTTKSGMTYYFENAAHKRLTKIEDVNGNTVTLNYSGTTLSSVTDPSGRAVLLGWNGGRLAAIADNNGVPIRIVNYEYNGQGQLTGVTDPLDAKVQYEYDPSGALGKVVNEKGDVLSLRYNNAGATEEVITCIAHTRFHYNPEQQKTYVVERNTSGDQLTTYSYDENGRLTGKSGNCCGYNIGYGYDTDNNISQLTDANGNQTFSNHDNTGNALVATDALGAQQQFTYDPVFNNLTSLKDKKGNQTQMTYDPAGNLIGITLPGNIDVSLAYSGNGNLSSMTDANDHTTQFTYNANNEVTTIQYPIGTELYAYDNVGNLKQTTDANNNPVFFEYDLLNRLKSVQDALGNTMHFGYDPASNLVSEKDANNNQKTFEYDAHNRITAVTTPAGTTRYTYDALDNLVGITDANGHTSRFRYDSRSLLVEEIDPLGNSTTYSHDGNGNVLTRTDPNGNVMTFSYDALNRVVQKSYEGNTDNYSYDANGNLVQCSNNHISMSFTYDALNRLTSKTIDNWGKTVQYDYDGNGNRISMTDPDGGLTQYEYDANDRPVKITNPAMQITQFFYDTGGRLVEQRNHNGTRAFFSYDAANRLLLLENKRSNGVVINSYAYTYDNNGNRLTMTPNAGGTHSYTYDGDNRLVSVSAPGLTEQYSFDSTGNRVQLLRNSIATGYTYNQGDRLLSAGAASNFQYDANGNQTRRNDGAQQALYEYDGENRLVRALMPNGTEALFRYDPFGNRISQTVDGVETRYLLDGDNVLLELDAAGATVARYTAAFAPDSWLCMQRGGQTYYYHTDGLGSVTALTSNAQTTAQTYQYDAYGNITASNGSVTNPYRYTGREYDNATGLYYYRTRYYDAREGRFLTRDDISGDEYRPLSLNRYNYVESNPVNFVDADGEIIHAVIGAVIVVARGIQVVAKAAPVVIRGAKAVLNVYKEFRKIYPGVKAGIKQIKREVNGVKKLIMREVIKTKLYKKVSRLKVTRLIRKVNRFCRKIVSAYEKIKRKTISEGIRKKYELEVDLLEYALDKAIDEFLEDDQAKEEPGIIEENLRSTACGDLFGKGENLYKGIQKLIDKFKEKLDSTATDKGKIEIPIIRSSDPNEIIAPPGVGAEKWVSAKATLPYTILFENDPDFATAAARRVVVEHVLDADLNPYTFRLGDFGFGSWYFEVPDNVSYYTTQIDLTDTFGVQVNVLAGIDATERRAFWIFESVDPATGLAASLPAEAGFLPVNDTLTGSGEGFVNFSARASTTALTGSKIDAQANIIFDDNAPIPTNIAFNTLDADAPQSGILMIDTASGGVYHLLWAGADVGSGLETYTLHVSTNGGPFLPAVGNLTGTGYTFAGQADSVYRFFTIARDSVGNVELPKYTGEPSCMQVTVVNIVDAPIGSTNGSAELVVAGNTGPLTYTWPHDPLLTGPIASGLAPGNYTVFVQDTAGCQVAVSFVVKALVGVETAADALIHRIYPVPTAGIVNVEYSAAGKTAYIQVWNSAGRMVLQRNIPADGTNNVLISLDVSDQPAGTYLVRLLTPSGTASGVTIKQ